MLQAPFLGKTLANEQLSLITTAAVKAMATQEPNTAHPIGAVAVLLAMPLLARGTVLLALVAICQDFYALA